MNALEIIKEFNLTVNQDKEVAYNHNYQDAPFFATQVLLDEGYTIQELEITTTLAEIKELSKKEEKKKVVEMTERLPFHGMW